MKCKVEYTQQAVKKLKELDKSTQNLILSWIEKNLKDCENPRIHGKGLSANLAGCWRYRVGNYRLIADINDETIIILIINIGHRSNIYD